MAVFSSKSGKPAKSAKAARPTDPTELALWHLARAHTYFNKGNHTNAAQAAVAASMTAENPTLKTMIIKSWWESVVEMPFDKALPLTSMALRSPVLKPYAVRLREREAGKALLETGKLLDEEKLADAAYVALHTALYTTDRPTLEKLGDLFESAVTRMPPKVGVAFAALATTNPVMGERAMQVHDRIRDMPVVSQDAAARTSTRPSVFSTKPIFQQSKL